MWIQQDHNITYPLTIAYPNISLVANPNPSIDHISVCASCKTNPNHNYSPYLCQIPPEITSVPLEKHKYLLPIFLHYSLGCTLGANPFSEYRTLVGTVNYSQNFHFLNLYSGILGAYLAAPASDHSVLPSWLDNSILIVPHQNFPAEIHNKDAHYSHLMARFISNSDTTQIPIALNDPNLEPLLFPDLYPNGHDHYHEMRNQLENIQRRHDTFGKYIKHRLLSKDS
ncbi:9993_t:CDS:2 [Cetraspora pellucida]|uniref:9993_t:CDS:1 n=1 Tax=Cetraspora pellucida TaxID=1433469 RepID=A0A9N9FSZ0_9GLOM|nr:9993_t:CDS:2 [Cetraspora pellucida]